MHHRACRPEEAAAHPERALAMDSGYAPVHGVVTAEPETYAAGFAVVGTM